MFLQKLVFVDIETTGCSFSYDRIIEIGIIRVEDKRVTAKYQSLINPQTYVSPFITKLTGITPDDLEDAPIFGSLKNEILSLLQGAVFVAHNARFDYGFLKTELAREGITFNAKQLCTVKLFKSLYPQVAHHDLDSLISHFRLRCRHRHRAYDDAEVLWKFIKLLHREWDSEIITPVLNRILKRPSIPIGLSQEILDSLPEQPGVYIFYGETGVPLYIGKSINIRERVLSHFVQTKSSGFELKIAQQVKSIETLNTPGELGALLLESKLVKKMQPLYNRKLRMRRNLVILRKQLNNSGYFIVKWEKISKLSTDLIGTTIGIFNSIGQMKKTLVSLTKKYQLCPKLLGLEKVRSSCFSYKLGTCKGSCIRKEKPVFYNARFNEAFYEFMLRKWPFPGPVAFYEDSQATRVRETFLVDKWCLLGSIVQDADGNTNSQPNYNDFDLDVYRLLNRYILQKKARNQIKLLDRRTVESLLNS